MCSGKELTEKMRVQAKNFGAEFVIAEVIDMELNQDVKIIRTTKGEYHTFGVILALGANPRKLGFKGEKEFQGRGIAYCATCDGEFFRGKDVFVIGGGFAAVEEGIFLTKYAKKVTMIVREEAFTCAKTVAEKVKNYDKIDVFFETEIVEAGGNNSLEYAKFRDNTSNEEWEYRVQDGQNFGIFVFAGYVPNTEWLNRDIIRNNQGYLITDENKKTNLDGVYAAGDVCIKNLRQVVTAVSDGAIAATALEKYVYDMHEKMGIRELRGNEFETAKEKEINERKQVKWAEKAEGFISTDIKEKLEGVFCKFESQVVLYAWLDDEPISDEVRGFLLEISELSDKITWKKAAHMKENITLPAIEVRNAEEKSSGIFFHGVPGGHEFNSFVIALYNVAGPGQDIEKEIIEEIADIKEKINIKILVSLSCTMCPETVMSAQRIASLSDYITAEMFDLAHFPKLREKYHVMSVPCLIINDEKVIFGKKNIKEIIQEINRKPLLP